MSASSADKMEEKDKKLVKQQLCWNANNVCVNSDGMEQEYEGQGT